MRYIAYIVFILVTATAGIFAFGRFDTPAPPDDAALIVNSRTLTLAELKDRYERNPYAGEDRDAFYESIITRELLIQEAQKTGIDREENFRRTVQEFFEQSLIKVLMDRKYQAFQEPLSPEELVAYRSRMDKRFQLTLLRYPTLKAAQERLGEDRESLDEAFLDLPALVREKLLDLAPGEETQPFASGHEFIVVHFDAERLIPVGEQTVLPDALLSKKIAEEKRALKMDQWVETLRRGAQVTVLPKSKELGGFQ